jgi:hypothetical protein
MAIRILRVNLNEKPLGKNWVTGFKKRNPRVKTCIGRPIDIKRIAGTQQEALESFYNLVEDTRTRFSIKTANIWNMDEHGIAEGKCVNTRVLAAAGRKRVYIQMPGIRDWVSILEAVSAAGQHIRPLVIFKGQNVMSNWFPENIPDWEYTASENGWTSNEKALNWLQTIFLPETAPEDGGHRMLIIDGHGSHETVDFLWLCKQNNLALQAEQGPGYLFTRAFLPRPTAARSFSIRPVKDCLPQATTGAQLSRRFSAS